MTSGGKWKKYPAAFWSEVGRMRKQIFPLEKKIILMFNQGELKHLTLKLVY